MASSRGRWIRIAVVGACSALAALRANADEIGLFGLIGAYHTDNGTQTADRKRSDTVGWLSFGTYGKWENNRLRTSWSLGEDGVKYFNGSFGAKNYTSGFLKFDYNTIPDLMTWHLYDSTGQVLVTPTAPDTPLNRANFNVVSTGPSFHVPVVGSLWVGADGSYAKTYYERATLNGDKWNADLGLNQNLAPKTDVGVYVGETEGTYKAFGQYKTERALGRFIGTGKFTTITADVGVNRAVLPYRTGTLASWDIAVERKFRDTSTFDLTLKRKITDPSETFIQLASGGYGPKEVNDGVNSNNIPNSVSLYDQRLFRLSYDTKRRINEFRLGLYYRKEDTLPGALFVEHRRIKGIDGIYRRIWGSKVGITLYGSYENHQGEIGGIGGYNERSLGIEVARPIWTVATRWVFTFEQKQRKGRTAADDYQEYRIGGYLRFSKFIFNYVKN